MVESQPSKLLVAGPIPVSRSMFWWASSPLGAADSSTKPCSITYPTKALRLSAPVWSKRRSATRTLIAKLPKTGLR